MSNKTFNSKTEAIKFAQDNSCPFGLYVRPLEDYCGSITWEVSCFANYTDEPYYMGKTLIQPDTEESFN